MSDYLQPLTAAMAGAADPQQAAQMAAYMRDQFSFYGVKSPRRREILKGFLQESGVPAVEDVPALVKALWSLPEREQQYNALDILIRLQKKLEPDFLPTLEWLITTKSWWDTVDSLASNISGRLFANFPDTGAAAVQKWRSMDNVWLRRTTLLHQLKYREKTDASLLFSLIEDNLEDNEFFIQKAIGWALREFSKTDETAVRDFVATTDLSSLAKREALKWLKNHPISN
jgi:3-methyladenine DNA glycosylase AlkD